MENIKLIAYNTWANRMLSKQIESLPPELFGKQFGGSFGSLKATLIHVMESDWIWLNRWKGIPLANVPDWQTDNAEAINKNWMPIQDEMLNVAEAFAGHGDRKIAFVTRKGAPYTLPFEDIVIHITHHGSYHRGQLANMIRVAGHNPVSTDYFIFSTS